MVRGIDEIQEILEEVQKKIFLANRSGDLDALLLKWELTDFIIQNNKNESYKSGKIVVIGGTEIKESVLISICKEFGIGKDRLEFCLDYDQAQKYNYRKLQYNSDYSVVLFGPVPHSARYRGDSESIIAELESQSGYPQVFRLMAGEELKITKSNFKSAIQNLLQNNIICQDY